MSPAALTCSPSTLVAPLIHGRRRHARVVGATRAAVYLLPYGDEPSPPYGRGAPRSYGKGSLFPYGPGPRPAANPGGDPLHTGPLDGESTPVQEKTSSSPYGPNSLFALVTCTGVRVPAAVLLSPAAGGNPFAGITPGAVARVGGGRIEWGPLRLAAGVSWAPPRVQDIPVAAALPVLARLSPPRRLPASIAPFTGRLIEALRSGTPQALRDPALALLGRGPGLTPSGDDYLCGLLLAAQVARASWLRPLSAALADAHNRTTFVSASLLTHAVRGHCIPQAADLLRATTEAGSVPAAPLAGLLSVGHSSGSDLLHGLCGGARLLTSEREFPTVDAGAGR